MLDKLLIILFIAANTLGRSIGDKYYFLCEAISIVLAALYMCNNSKGTTLIIAQWALILTVNNLLDELFFNPCVYGWNEGVILILATVRGYRQYMKQNGRHKG